MERADEGIFVLFALGFLIAVCEELSKEETRDALRYKETADGVYIVKEGREINEKQRMLTFQKYV